MSVDGKKIKHCPGCNTSYFVEVGVTFNRKKGAVDGLQPWCRRCDARNKHTDRQYAWTRFLATLRAEGNEHLWTRADYFKMMGDFECATCGAVVTNWAGGHSVDRISSRRGHVPGNCRPCCWGCNRMKSNRNPESFQHDINALIERYGRGLIPWDEIDPHIRHVDDKVPDLRAYVAERQLMIPGAA